MAKGKKKSDKDKDKEDEENNKKEDDAKDNKKDKDEKDKQKDAEDADSGTGDSTTASKASLKSTEKNKASDEPPKPAEPAAVPAVIEPEANEVDPEPRVNLLVGPIIGHVTSSSAIILIEIDTDYSGFECILRTYDNPEKPLEVNEVLDIKARSPTVFVFKNLQPHRAFNVIAPAISDKNIGIVRTLPANIKKLNIAVVSCNKCLDDEEPACDMWGRLWSRVNADYLQIVLHIGDQVLLIHSLQK